MIKRHKSAGTDQIPVELIKAGGRNICSAIHKRINFIWNKEELPEEWKESIIVLYLSSGRAIKVTVGTIGTYHFANYVQNFIQHPALRFNSMCRGNYWGSSVWISTQEVDY
jgi:hypothetical protein